MGKVEMFFSRLKKALVISRPIFWLSIVATYLLGIYAGGSGFSVLELFEAFLLSFPFCFYMFGINDLYDIKTDSINSRKKNAVWGRVFLESDSEWIKQWSFAVVLVFLFVSALTLNVAHFLAALFYVVATYAYSSPPLRLKSVPIIDSLINASYSFGPFAMGYSLSGSYGFLDLRFVLFALTFSAGHAIAAIADYKEDKKAGIRTFATVFGPRIPALFAFVILAANVPFAFSVVKSSALVLVSYALLAAVLAAKPELGKKAVTATVVIFLLWAFYFTFAWVLGTETINIPR